MSAHEWKVGDRAWFGAEAVTVTAAAFVAAAAVALAGVTILALVKVGAW